MESRNPCRTTRLLRPNLPTLGRHGVGTIRLFPSPDLPYRGDNPFYPDLPTSGIYGGCGKNLSICSHQARLRSHIRWTIATSCKICSQFVHIRQDPDLPTSGKIMIYPHQADSATSHRICFGSAHFKQIWCWHDVLLISHIRKTPFLPRSAHISKHLW